MKGPPEMGAFFWWSGGGLREGGERVAWLGAVGRRNLGTRKTRPLPALGVVGTEGVSLLNQHLILKAGRAL